MCGVFYVRWRKNCCVPNWDKFEDEAFSCLSNRGSDDWNFKVDDGAIFAHSRLRIIGESSTGIQPVVKNSKVLLFNGEIYNYRDLPYSTLVQDTHPSDTDALFDLLDSVDDAVQRQSRLSDLRGQFAIVFDDRTTREVLFARDYFGEKPLNFCFNDQVFIVSSSAELIARYLRKTLGVCSINQAFIDSTLEFGFHFGPESPFIGISRLPRNRVGVLNYEAWSLAPTQAIYRECRSIPAQAASTKKLRQMGLKGLLEKSVTRAMTSDQRVGLLLSGGIDSAVVAVCLSKFYPDTLCIIVHFPGHNDRDKDYAKKTAETLSLPYVIYTPSEGEIGNGLKEIQLLDSDLCVDGSGVAVFLAATYAKTLGLKVLLTGDGGDEIFYGYNRHYFWYNKWTRLILRRGTLALNLLRTFLKIPELQQKIYRLRHMSMDLESVTDFYVEAVVHTGNSHNRQMAVNRTKAYLRKVVLGGEKDIRDLELDYYLSENALRKVDVYGLAAGVEIRSPFLDYDLFKFVVENFDRRSLVNTLGGKLPLKRFLISENLKFLVSNRKTGFSTPMATFLNHSTFNLFGAEPSDVADSTVEKRMWARLLIEKFLARHEAS